MLGITRSKCGATVSPRSRAAAGAAKAIAKAAPAARRADLISMAVVLLTPPLVDTSPVQHEVPRTDKTRRLPVHAPPAAVGARSQSNDAARAANSSPHQER